MKSIVFALLVSSLEVSQAHVVRNNVESQLWGCPAEKICSVNIEKNNKTVEPRNNVLNPPPLANKHIVPNPEGDVAKKET